MWANYLSSHLQNLNFFVSAVQRLSDVTDGIWSADTLWKERVTNAWIQWEEAMHFECNSGWNLGWERGSQCADREETESDDQGGGRILQYWHEQDQWDAQKSHVQLCTVCWSKKTGKKKGIWTVPGRTNGDMNGTYKSCVKSRKNRSEWLKKCVCYVKINCCVRLFSKFSLLERSTAKWARI